MLDVQDDKISIIIPAHDAQRTIERCLKSVAEQTYRNLEIIVVDDGSTDNTWMLLNKMAGADSRIRVIHKDNGGASSARNRALEEIKGSYVAFLDADDFIESELYEQLYCAAKERQLDIVSASLREIYPGDIVEEQVNDSNYPIISGIEALCDMYSYVDGIRTVVWDKLYRREVIAGIKFDEDIPYGEDTLYNCQAMLRCRKYGKIPYVGYTYDHRESQMTGGEYCSAKLCNVKVVERMKMHIEGALSGNRRCQEAIDCLNRYRLEVCQQLFRAMRKTNPRVDIREDYTYLKEYAQKISSSYLRHNLSWLYRLQWFVYMHGFECYRKAEPAVCAFRKVFSKI